MKCRFSECAVLNNKLYSYDITSAMFSELDLESKVLKCLPNSKVKMGVPGEDYIYYVRLYKSKLFCVTNDGRKIVVVDLADNSFETIKIDCNYSNWDNFICCEVIDGNMYLFVRNHCELVRFDLENYEVQKIEYICDSPMSFFRGTVLGNTIILSGNTCSVGIYNISDNKLSIKQFENNIGIADYAEAPNGNIYALANDGALYLVTNEDDVQFSFLQNLAIDGQDTKSCLIATDMGVLAFPNNRNGHITSWKFGTDDVKTELLSIKYDDKNWTAFKGKYNDGKYIYVASRLCDEIIRVSVNDFSIECLNYEVDETIRIQNLLALNGLLTEEEIGLDNFLKYVLK